MKNNQVDIFAIIRRRGIESYIEIIDNYDINLIDSYKKSFLHTAIAYGKRDIALDLLDRGINVNIQDYKGATPLHYIGFYPDYEIAEKIISKSGELEIKDLYGNTPLWYIVGNVTGNYDIVKLFIEKGANPHSKNNANKSPFDSAIINNDSNLVKLLNNYI